MKFKKQFKRISIIFNLILVLGSSFFLQKSIFESVFKELDNAKISQLVYHSMQNIDEAIEAKYDHYDNFSYTYNGYGF